MIRIAFGPALRMLLLITAITGGFYPLAVTAIGALAFPFQTRGSVIERGGAAVGSGLIAQPFASPGYFWPRPSATSGPPYATDASGGSNRGPLDPALVDSVRARVQRLQLAGRAPAGAPPVDLVTASASGLDPHVSPQAARWQAPRVAAARGLPPEDVMGLVERHVEPPTFGVLGEPRVNVLELNLALDDLARRRAAAGQAHGSRSD